MKGSKFNSSQLTKILKKFNQKLSMDLIVDHEKHIKEIKSLFISEKLLKKGT